MKKIYIVLLFLIAAGNLRAQSVSPFDNLTLLPNTYWDGSDLSGGFNSGNAFFPNFYDTSWGGYWSGGWTYSNQSDTSLITPSPSQLYCSRAGSGFNASPNFAVGTQGSIIVPTGVAAGKAIGGVYITNCTYAYNSMALGDAFAKQFGGASGNDPDFFKLTIRKYLGGVMTNDSIEFYLADYRFSDNSQDYIVTEWTFVNLLPLGNCDSLAFMLSSSDVGGFGMNTPAYYCIDNFITMDSPQAIASIAVTVAKVGPTLCTDRVNISFEENTVSTIHISDMNGRMVFNETLSGQNHNINVSFLNRGMYVLEIINDKQKQDFKIIKQ